MLLAFLFYSGEILHVHIVYAYISLWQTTYLLFEEINK